MYAVGLEQAGLRGEAIQQERHQRQFPAPGDLAEDALELFKQQGFKYATQIGTLVGGEPRIVVT